MYNTIKQVAFIIVIALTFTFTSCSMNDIEPAEQRTEALELTEIDQVLAQIEEEGLNIDTTELGIFYIVDTLGAGPTPQAGDTCFMKYQGFLFNGTVFDDSSYHPDNQDGIWEFIYKENSLIPGFDDGIALMSKGTRLDMIIPSSLAYGEYGNYSIPAYTTLVFSAEMVDLRPGLLD